MCLLDETRLASLIRRKPLQDKPQSSPITKPATVTATAGRPTADDLPNLEALDAGLKRTVSRAYTPPPTPAFGKRDSVAIAREENDVLRRRMKADDARRRADEDAARSRSSSYVSESVSAPFSFPSFDTYSSPTTSYDPGPSFDFGSSSSSDFSGGGGSFDGGGASGSW